MFWFAVHGNCSRKNGKCVTYVSYPLLGILEGFYESCHKDFLKFYYWKSIFYTLTKVIYKSQNLRASGWLSWLSVPLQLGSQSHSSGDQAPHQAHCCQPRAHFRSSVPSLPLHQSRHLPLKNEQKKKRERERIPQISAD